MFHKGFALWLALQSFPVSLFAISGFQRHAVNKRAGSPQFQMDLSIVQWDQSCGAPSPAINPWNSDPGDTKQDAIARAWAGAMELAEDAQNRFNLIKSNLDKFGNNSPNRVDLLEIDKFDPAYLQFFRGSYNPRVTNEIKRILDNIRNVLTWKPTNPYSIRNPDLKFRIYINCNGQAPECSTNNGLTPFAATSQQFDTRVPLPGAMITFCDIFFQAPRFDKKKAGVLTAAMPPGPPDQPSPDLWYWLVARHLQWQSSDFSKVHGSTDASIIIHELTHLLYVGPTNLELQSNGVYVDGLQERRGWLTCAQLANNDKEEVQAYKNADSYAWYAEYGYFRRRMVSDPWPAVGPLRKPVTR